MFQASIFSHEDNTRQKTQLVVIRRERKVVKFPIVKARTLWSFSFNSDCRIAAVIKCTCMNVVVFFFLQLSCEIILMNCVFSSLGTGTKQSHAKNTAPCVTMPRYRGFSATLNSLISAEWILTVRWRTSTPPTGACGTKWKGQWCSCASLHAIMQSWNQIVMKDRDHMGSFACRKPWMKR